MSQTLTEIAQTLKANNKKVQLIYAFNGTGKTRLSREFKEKVDPKDQKTSDSPIKFMYYNAFTEDLFYWDNDLDEDTDRKLKVFPNGFTELALSFLKTHELDNNIITNFQHFTTSKITPSFNENFSEITFNYLSGGDDSATNIKISKGEESNFIWCVFYSLLEQVIELLNKNKDERSNHDFDELEYVFIDDPVSSLDDNHLIELAVNLASLIRNSNNLKFIISTHNPLFFNVLYNELPNKDCFMLSKNEDGSCELVNKGGDSNQSFSYHIHLINTLKSAIASNSIEKFHFMLLRNLYEKTANFLGYKEWKLLLPEDRQLYYKRIIQFTSHSTLSAEFVPEPTVPEKQTVRLLLKHLLETKYDANLQISEQVSNLVLEDATV